MFTDAQLWDIEEAGGGLEAPDGHWQEALHWRGQEAEVRDPAGPSFKEILRKMLIFAWGRAEVRSTAPVGQILH